MSNTESRPASASHYIIGAQLKKLRKEAGVSQIEVEKACKLQRTSLSRYEAGRSAMTTIAAERVFEYYGVAPERVNVLLDRVRETRSRSHRTTPDSAPQWFQSFLLLEQEASEVAELALTMIPGLLQTEDYARTVLAGGVVGSDVDEHVATRMKRKEALTRHDDPMRFWAVIHEATLLRLVGNKRIMAEQLSQLLEMAKLPNVSISVIPNAQGAHISMGANFHWIKFAEAPGPGIIYTEDLAGARYRDDPNEVHQYEEAFRRLISTALSEIDSVQFIKRVATTHYE